MLFLSIISVYLRGKIDRSLKSPCIMNNVTDITILIAVIALALWPITLFALRINHERKNKL